MKARLLIVSALSLFLAACGGGADTFTETAKIEDEKVVAVEGELIVEPMTSVMSMAASVKTAGGLSTYGQSPTQIRSRYGLSNFTSPAQQGAGQVIAIIGAYNNVNASADLAKFSEHHGLPACPYVPNQYKSGSGGYTEVTNTGPSYGCTLQIINVNAQGKPNAMLYNGVWKEMSIQTDAAWAAETTMDIQWAHAIAPMAKIILVQAPNNYVNALAFASQYGGKVANTVTMSWGAPEKAFAAKCYGYDGPQCTSDAKTKTLLYGPSNPIINGYASASSGGYDTIGFSNVNATYVAASGDNGSVPMWPSVSNRVLSVGATNSLGVNDTAWSGSGGGVAQYYSSPTYQSGYGYTGRATPDVSFVGDPASPVSVYITPSKYMPDKTCVNKYGASNCGWYGGYGTSAGAPQWAGIIAISKAMRAQSGMSQYYDVNTALYNIANVPGNYVSAFKDVTSGSNGNLTKTGYDLVTGLGVPNVSNLVNYLVQ